MTAVRRIAAGETVLDPQISLASVLKGERNSGLTARQLEILRLIVGGKSNNLVVYAIRNGLANLP